MGGNSLFEAVSAWLRRRRVAKTLQLAQGWAQTTGEVLSWMRVPADPDVASFSAPEQIEAKYYFTVNGEYFGGLFRSVALSRSETAAIHAATPKVQVRYDPANPDSAVVLAEDNVGNLPFRVLSGY